MSAVFERLMLEIYGHDIWQGIAPDTVDEQVQGWNGVHPSLSQLPTGFSEQIIIDIGVWKGQSTITLANNLRDNNIDGVVIAVDTFLGSPEHWDSTHGYFNRLNGMPDIYRTFLSNVAARGLTRFVIPMPQTSTTACAVLKAKNISPTLVHVDAAHEYREALNDISDYWDIVAPGGVMIGDDYHETWPGVIKAADEFSSRIRVPITVEPPKFILKKI